MTQLQSNMALALHDLQFQVFDALPMGIALYSAHDRGSDFVIEALNPAATEISQVILEEAIGGRLTEVFPGAREMGMLSALQQVHESGEDLTLPPLKYEDEQRGQRWYSNQLIHISDQHIMAVYSDVTEQMTSQESLVESRRRYSLLTEAMADGVFDWNVDSGSVYFSPSWKHQLGYRQQDLENSFATWRDLMHASDRRQVMDDLQDFLSSGNNLWEHDFRLRQRDGEYRWIRARGTAVRDDQERVTRIIGVHIDIDQMKHADAERSQQRLLIEAIYRAMPDLFFLVDPRGKILAFHAGEQDLLFANPSNLINRRVDDILPPDVAEMQAEARARALDSGDVETIEYPLTVGGEHRVFEARMRASEDRSTVSSIVRDITEQYGLRQLQAERVKELSALFQVQRAALEESELEPFARRAVEAMVGAMQQPESVWGEFVVGETRYHQGHSRPVGEHCEGAIVVDGRRVGALSVDFHLDCPPLQEERNFLQAAARTVSLWLQSSEARNNLATYQQIVSNTQDMVALLDVNGRYLIVNRSYAERLNKTPADLEGATAQSVFGDEHWEQRLLPYFGQCLSGDIQTFQEFRDTPLGPRYFNVIYAPFIENGVVTGVVVSAHDITELDEARSSLQRTARVFSDTSEAILFINRDGLIEDVNAAAEQISGYERFELVGEQADAFLSNDNPAESMSAAQAALAEVGHWHGEILVRHKNGEGIPGLITVSAMRSEVGNDASEVSGYSVIFADVSEMKANEARLQRMALEDSLTGLPNRAQLMRVIERNIELAQRSLQPFAIMFIDLDRFKDVNDSLGHSAGDTLLKHATERLRSVLRANDVLARVGGDEFVAVFPGLDSGGNASIIADKMIDAMTSAFDLDGRPTRVSCSIGIASYPTDGDTTDLLLRNADTAMYQAKADGRAAWRCYSDDMTQRAARHLFLISGLRHAIAVNEGLRMVYQPQFDIDTGSLSGFEALLRWEHPEQGTIAPHEFIPAAEESALIKVIDGWVIEQVCHDLANSGFMLIEDVRVSVNVGGVSLGSAAFADQMRAALARYDVPGALIELEVSERALLNELDLGRLDLDWLKDLDVGLSVDDFGTSYSSLLELKRLPVRRLKIDGGFVRDLPEQPDGAAITAAIIAIGRSLDLEVVAEGIETESQAHALGGHKGLKAQGYLYGQPVEADELANFRE